MMRRRTSTHIRLVAGCLAGVLAIAACGSSESSGDRDRNLPAEPAPFFTTAVDGVARNRIGDASIAIPFSVSDRAQADGSTLVSAINFVADGDGVRTEIYFTRLNQTGEFDPTLGVDGVQTWTLRREIVPIVSMTSDGYAVAAVATLAPFGSSQFVELLRYDVKAGKLDESFGNKGRLVLDPVFTQGSGGLLADNGGGVIVVGSDSDTGERSFASRWTAAGRDVNFGVNGRLDLDAPTFPGAGIDEKFSCDTPVLGAERGRATAVVYGCGLSREVTNENGNVVPYMRRAIATRFFDEAGEFAGPATIAFLDAPDEALPFGSRPEVFDVDFEAGDAAAESYITINGGGGTGEVVTLTDIYSKFVRRENTNGSAGMRLPSSIFGRGEAGQRILSFARFMSNPLPRIVGLSIDTVSQSTKLETAGFPLDATYWGDTVSSDNGLPISDLPAISHGFDRVSYVGNDVFLNVVADGVTEFRPFTETRQRLVDRDGYMKIGRDGAVVAPYGSSKGMAEISLKRADRQLDTFVVPGLLPAVDGSMYSVSFRFEPVEPGAGIPNSILAFTKFDGAGKVIGETAVVSKKFNPFFNERATVAFDGIDNFYLVVFSGADLGVAKFSLSKESFDPEYGEGGFVKFPGGSQPGTNFDWVSAQLQVATDGTVDAIRSGFAAEADEYGRHQLEIKTVRFTPQGVIDASSPEATILIPEHSRCQCTYDRVSAGLADAAVVDAAGRLLVVLPQVRAFDEAGNELAFGPTAFNNGGKEGVFFRGGGEIRRFQRDGKLDPTFGTNGVGGVSMYKIGADIPIGQPRIALDDKGNIFTTVIGMELGVPENARTELDLTIEGEYSYSVMLNADGVPINFTPREQSPAGKFVTGLVDDSKPQISPTPPSTPGTTSDAGTTSATTSVITAPPGAGTDDVIPADVVQVTGATSPAVTITGTPADRAIEVRWSVPASLANDKANYTVVASPGGQKCTTSTTSCVFKKLEPWTPYTFTIKTVSASSASVPDSAPSVPVKPVRIVKRGSRTEPTKLITPASTGKQTWKAAGGCKVTKDGKTFTATKDAGLCTLSLTTAKAGKVPKTTRTITVVVRAIAK